MKLQPQLFNLANLLGGRLFRIPEYQRAYSWETKQRRDLFNDIERVRESNEDHFMATIVGLTRARRQIIADEFLEVEIVDGQQRLTTLIVLLKAIQRALDGNDKTERKLSDELCELLVKGDGLNLLLLQTNHDSSHLFADYIRDGAIPTANGSTSADQNIIDAIRESEDFVTRWKDNGGSYVELISIIRNRLWAIFHAVDDESLVYRVFEVLNSRGLDVSWIDKLKSQLMGLAFETGPSGGREEAIRELHSIWQNIYEVIGKQKYLTRETVRFAGTLIASTIPSRPLSEEASVKRLVDHAGTNAKQIVVCARWLQSVVKAEDELLSKHRWRAVTEILQARLVAIAVRLRSFSASDEREILGYWERISFRIYGLGGGDARTRVGGYTRLAWRIMNEDMSCTQVVAGLREIGEGYSISEVMDRFDPSNCYDGWTEQLRYLFYRYDEQLAAEHGEALNESQWNKIWGEEPARSIEHIKPQSSGVSYVHRLGNLMMLPPGINSSLRDKDPKDKARIYQTSGLLSAVGVAKLIKSGGWDRRAVDARTAGILEWVRRQWND